MLLDGQKIIGVELMLHRRVLVGGALSDCNFCRVSMDDWLWILVQVRLSIVADLVQILDLLGA